MKKIIKNKTSKVTKMCRCACHDHDYKLCHESICCSKMNGDLVQDFIDEHNSQTRKGICPKCWFENDRHAVTCEKYEKHYAYKHIVLGE